VRRHSGVGRIPAQADGSGGIHRLHDSDETPSHVTVPLAAGLRQKGLLWALIWSAGGRALLVLMVLAAAAASRMGPERHA